MQIVCGGDIGVVVPIEVAVLERRGDLLGRLQRRVGGGPALRELSHGLLDHFPVDDFPAGVVDDELLHRLRDRRSAALVDEQVVLLRERLDEFVVLVVFLGAGADVFRQHPGVTAGGDVAASSFIDDAGVVEGFAGFIDRSLATQQQRCEDKEPHHDDQDDHQTIGHTPSPTFRRSRNSRSPQA